MPRWEPGGSDRLQEAAFQLFEERGYERTGVADIAARAGLTQRSFYTHFADKREVLFGFTARYQREVLAAIAARSGAPSLDLVVSAMRDAVDAVFEEHRAVVVRRQAIVSTTEELREREAAKGAALAGAIARALQARGIGGEDAAIIAGTALLVQQVAFARWIAIEGIPLRDALTAAMDAVRQRV